jgi:hypothetical protein
MLISFLIPTYQRPQLVLRSAISVLSQCTQANKEDVLVWINDDCSDCFPFDQITSSLASYENVATIRVSRNSENKGMSRNILDMTQSVESTFWTVLTDDDLLEDQSLGELMEALQEAKRLGIQSLFTPRYCYSADAEFRFKDYCSVMSFPSIIPPGPVSSVKHALNAHVLTGHVMSSSFDPAQWQLHIENAYFPVLNFGASLLFSPCMVVDRPWFRHTIENETFWHRWGPNHYQQGLRLLSDYLEALHINFDRAMSHSLSPAEQSLCLMNHYRRVFSYLAFRARSTSLLFLLSSIWHSSYLSRPNIAITYSFISLACALLAPFSMFLDFSKRIVKKSLRAFL